MDAQTKEILDAIMEGITALRHDVSEMKSDVEDIRLDMQIIKAVTNKQDKEIRKLKLAK